MSESTTRRLAGARASWLLVVVAASSAGCLPEVFEERSLPPPPKPVSNWTMEEARQFKQFPLYWLGEAYQGLPLTSIRIAGPDYADDSVRYVRVSLWYGEPSVVRDSGVAYWNSPLEISIFHRCDQPPEYVLRFLDKEYLDDELIDGKQVLGVDAYVERYDDKNAALWFWTDRSAVHLVTWNADLDTERAARDLIPIAAESGVPPQTLPQPVSLDC